jgi:agmatine/peptidylarginine deiminase
MELIGAAFSDREVVVRAGRDHLVRGRRPHCITQQVPAGAFVA